MTDPTQLRLRDIHLPEPVSWWPLAIGWWIVMALLLLIIGLSVWLYLRRRRRRLSAGYLARVELSKLRERYLQHEDVRLLASDISILLRRLSISAYPREESASLTGERWLQHLDRPLPENPFTSGAGRILIEAPYRRNVRIDEIDPLFKLCEDWIDAVSGGKGKQAV